MGLAAAGAFAATWGSSAAAAASCWGRWPPRPERPSAFAAARFRIFPNVAQPIATDSVVCVNPRYSAIPAAERVRRATISWGDGTRTRLMTLSRPVAHTYARGGHYTISLRVKISKRGRGGRSARTLVHKRNILVQGPAVLTVASGLDMLDLDGFGNPFTDYGTISMPVLSGDGNHVAWEYDAGDAIRFGFIWRDLTNGDTIDQPGVYPYALSMSADGTYVAYSQASQTASNGYVTAMAVWLWDTATNQRTPIDRLGGQGTADDGESDSLSVSANGDFVAFESESQQLAPPGVTTCPTCIEGGGYIYLYNRLLNHLQPVPDQAMFTACPTYAPPNDCPTYTSLSDPVISADGSVVAFHDGLDTDVWYPQDNVVRRLSESDFTCLTDSPGLALSADGSTLASDCGSGIGVVRLGGPSGPDTVEWQYAPSDWNSAVTSAALSNDGSTLAFIGPGPVGGNSQGIWTVSLPSGNMTLLPAPPLQIPGLNPEPTLQDGMGGNQVTISLNGQQVAAAACTLQAESPQSQDCPVRDDLFRWNLGGG